MPAPILQIKRGAAANIGIASLRAGEPGFTTDKYDFYIGLNGIANDQKFFGSHRYWDREQSGTKALSLKLVSDNGSESINLRSPVSLGSTFTYTLPATGIGNSGKVLSTDESGVLSWVDSVNNFTIGQIISGFGTFTNNVAFTSTTDNILGNPDTGAVQIDGGLGVNKNVSIGGSIHVQGQSYFVGIVTFAGGTINLGDGNTDNINVGGEFVSGLAPNADNTYDIGISTQRWRDAYFAGIGSFATGAYIDNVRIGISGTNVIDTVSGDLTLNSASGLTIIDDNLSVTGIATITGAFVANGNVILGDTSGDTITINGTTTFNQPLVGTIGTATRATTVDITDTDAQSGGIVFGSAGTGSTLYNDTDLTYNSNTNVLSVPIVSATTEVRTGSVKAADGTTAITITNSTGAVATNGNLTVGGDLIVNGSTTQVNTDTLTVEDRTIELGRVIAGQPTTTTWDLAVLFNYGDAGTARKSGLVWEASGATKRFQFTTDVSTGADGGPADTNLPAFAVANFAPIEILELWLNDTAGSSVVASYLAADGLFTGSAAGRYLQNITVDAGTF